MFRALIRAMVPKPIRLRVNDRRRAAALLRGLSHVATGRTDAATIDALVYGWSNEGWSASREFLARAAALARCARGPILECGSGLTTLVIGRICDDVGGSLVALEHHAEWARKLRAALAAYDIRSARVIDAPLRSYGDFDWYRVAGDLGWFDLVVCDGPPSSTRGGRYGLLPIMGPSLLEGATVLLDDAARQDEREVLFRWAQEAGWTYVVGAGERPYACVRIASLAASRHPPSFPS